MFICMSPGVKGGSGGRVASTSGAFSAAWRRKPQIRKKRKRLEVFIRGIIQRKDRKARHVVCVTTEPFGP